MRVEREHPRLRLGGEQHLEQYRLLLLEGARQRDAGVKALDHLCDELLGGQRLRRSGLDQALDCDGLAHRGGTLPVG